MTTYLAMVGDWEKALDAPLVSPHSPSLAPPPNNPHTPMPP